VALPAYAPTDDHDLHVALTEIDRRLTAWYPNRLARKALLGYSLGGFEALFIASTEPASQQSLIQFDRVVAINAPVSLSYGMTKLDEYYQAPLAWPAAQRTDKLQNTFLKVAALSRTSMRPQAPLPFDAVESKFLIGLTFRFMLRDIIFSSQQRHNQGVLRQPLKNSRRDPAYQEIMEFSYEDYYTKFVIPYYRTLGIDLAAPDALVKAGDLRSRAKELRADPHIRLIVNQDDFLMSDADLAWLRDTFSPDQLAVFARGGHLGNLAHPAVQRAIIAGFADLKPNPEPPKVLVPPKPKDTPSPASIPVIR
jgi:pimeloyl-ACP methyl ester carboxylesterase